MDSKKRLQVVSVVAVVCVVTIALIIGVGLRFSPDTGLGDPIADDYQSVDNQELYVWETPLFPENFADYDASIVTFPESHRISAFLDDAYIHMDGRNIYPARVRNHDHVWLPMEPLFEALEVRYTWDDEANELHIHNLGRNLMFRPGQEGYTTSRYVSLRQDGGRNFDRDWQPPFWLAPLDSDVPFFIEEKSSGLYVHSMFFSEILREDPTDRNSGPLHQPWVVPIYHEHGTVVFAPSRSWWTHEEPFFVHDIRANRMPHHFERADFPVEQVAIILEDFRFRYMDAFMGLDFTPDRTEMNFRSGRHFVVSTKLDDYVMLPIVELMELIGGDAHYDESGQTVTLRVGDQEHILADGEPIRFHRQSNLPSRTTWHEVAPMLVDGTMFISHNDLERLHSNQPQENNFLFSSIDRRAAELTLRLLYNIVRPSGVVFSGVGYPYGFIESETEHGRAILMYYGLLRANEDGIAYVVPADGFFRAYFTLILHSVPESYDVRLILREGEYIDGVLEPSVFERGIGMANYFVSFHFSTFDGPLERLLLVVGDLDIAEGGFGVVVTGY